MFERPAKLINLFFLAQKPLVFVSHCLYLTLKIIKFYSALPKLATIITPLVILKCWQFSTKVTSMKALWF